MPCHAMHMYALKRLRVSSMAARHQPTASVHRCAVCTTGMPSNQESTMISLQPQFEFVPHVSINLPSLPRRACAAGRSIVGNDHTVVLTCAGNTDARAWTASMESTHLQ
mmetsp:Transcript_83205/g.201718  ORF Transcript_83205/g.201718 Transcript_83205/m.201718 type:complete len:109 (-) Transcript_83205:25-351(-)